MTADFDCIRCHACKRRKPLARERPMSRSCHAARLLGWLIVAAACVCPARAQFAARVLGSGAMSHIGVADVAVAGDGASSPTPGSSSISSSGNATEPPFIEQGISLPQCPFHRVLSSIGIPANWRYMPMEAQVAEPLNAAMVQMAYVPWQQDPKRSIGKCLHNLGIDLESVSIVHKAVLPYLGTMTAVVMRAGGQGVYVSFRGTDFDDPGDVLVDADCQHTEDKGKMFGTRKDLRLHTGFYRAWESVAPIVISAVEQQLELSQIKRVYIIGHSLGAAMAAIAALRLNYMFRHTDNEVGGVWLYGCPRVGNKAWAEEYNRRLLHRTLRFANFGDFASRLPMTSQVCTSARLISNFDFGHVGRAIVLCPDAQTGLTNWHLYPNGTEVLDCGPRPDAPDFTVSTHWLGSYLDAWRRAYTAVYNETLAEDIFVSSVMCSQCSLSFPEDRAKQLNVPARAGGPIGCSTTASCTEKPAWEAAALVGTQLTRSFNPASTCDKFTCT